MKFQKKHWFFDVLGSNSKKTLGFFLEFYKIPKKKKKTSFPKFQNSKKKYQLAQIFLEFWKTRVFFWNFGFTKLEKTLQLSKKNKAMRISQNMFGILKNSVVCNVSASFVLNCLHLSIIGFHLVIRSVHFLTRSSYLRTTFYLCSIHLSTYFCTHGVVLID